MLQNRKRKLKPYQTRNDTGVKDDLRDVYDARSGENIQTY